MRARFRIPLKMLIFAAVLLAVTYPDPRLLLRHVNHVSNMNRMIDPDAPGLAVLEAELRQRLATFKQDQAHRSHGVAASEIPSTHHNPDSGEGTPENEPREPSERDVFAVVERFTTEKVYYAWDWDTWGAADYMPTVAEMLAAAERHPDARLQEDCDGRAVLAASLLQRLGYDAQLMTDLRHVWVRSKTTDGRTVQIMGPGRAASVQSTRTGNRYDWTTLLNAPVALSFGVAVFPWFRELIVLLTLAGLLYDRRMSWRAAAAGLLFMIAGWQLLRLGVVWVGQAGQPGYRWAERPVNAWLGLMYVAIGCTVLVIAARRARRCKPPEEHRP